MLFLSFYMEVDVAANGDGNGLYEAVSDVLWLKRPYAQLLWSLNVLSDP